MPRGQIVRLTTRTVEATELVHDRFAAAIADNIVTVEEQQELGVHIRASYDIAMKTDVAYGIGVAILRGGVESGYAKEQGFDPSRIRCIGPDPGFSSDAA